MDQKQLLIILADISGYTRFMLENQTAALDGQAVITGLIESILREVDIPLTLQEIEGDAVFLYAAHPGSEEGRRTVVEQVGMKLGKFFDAFIHCAGRGRDRVDTVPVRNLFQLRSAGVEDHRACGHGGFSFDCGPSAGVRCRRDPGASFAEELGAEQQLPAAERSRVCRDGRVSAGDVRSAS
jgi:hypothetical protein